MTWAKLDDLIITETDNEIIFTEEDGAGILECMEFLLCDYSTDYIFKHGCGSGRIKEDSITIAKDDYSDALKNIIEVEKKLWY